MRKIKFRGLDINSNKFVYGYFFKCGFRFCIVVDNPNGNGQTIYHVQPSSVAQLCGRDSQGAEVYEGDTLIDESGFCKPPYNKFVVRLKPHGYKYTIDADGSRDYSCVTFEMRGHNDLSNFRLEEKAI